MKSSQPVFIAILKSGKQFIGGNDYFNTKWKEISDPIGRLYCRLPDGNFLMLCGYEKYNFLVEGTQDFSFPKGQTLGKVRVEYLYAMGKKGNKVDSYRITLFNQTTRVFKIIMKNEKEQRIIVANKGYKFFVKDRKVLARSLKPKDKVSIYNYGTRNVDIFEIVSNETIIQEGRYKMGDIVKREFNINDERIKKLNSSGWK